MRARNAGWIVAMVAALALGACSPLTAAAPADTQREVIMVSGVGQAQGDPDIASITVGVNVADESISVAVDESNGIIEDITQAMIGLGVPEDDIQTTNFSVYAEDQWDPATGQRLDQRLYHVDSNLSIRIHQVERVGEVLQAAIENGANNIYGLSFGIEDTSSLATQARSIAIADARMRAQEMATELGVSVGEIVSISETSGAVPAYFEAAYGIGGGGGGPPISEGAMTVTINVTASYAIER